MAKKKIKVGLIGATGYGGVGLIELLINHPSVTISALIAKQETGKPISTVYPHLKGFCDLPVFDPVDPRCPHDFDIMPRLTELVKKRQQSGCIKVLK
jgi:N-acetyl-gamma-glutamyl-phosphate reductase